MPYRQADGLVLRNGLYLLTQHSVEKGVDHFGVLDVGNRLRISEVDGLHPVVLHQTPPRIQWTYLEGTGSWHNYGRIVDETSAIARIHLALQTPEYNLFSNNCEHFGRLVATGKRESLQLRGGLVFAGLTVGVLWVAARV